MANANAPQVVTVDVNTLIALVQTLQMRMDDDAAVTWLFDECYAKRQNVPSQDVALLKVLHMTHSVFTSH